MLYFVCIYRYFEWVCKIQEFLTLWKKKFHTLDVNHDEILMYANWQSQLNSIGHSVDANSVVTDSKKVEETKNQFLKLFEQLNCLLIKYIPNIPGSKWCTLPSLLRKYDVVLPTSTQSIISKGIIFPNENKPHAELLSVPPVPNINNQFQPGCNISLKMTKSISLKMLSDLVDELKEYQSLLLDHLDTLVFFKLNQSIMFDTYIQMQIREAHKEFTKPQVAKSEFSVISFNMPPASAVFQQEEQECDSRSKNTLLEAVVKTEHLLRKIMEGTATYSEITAMEELDLENLDIEAEFESFTMYIVSVKKLPNSSCKGIKPVKSMLELFKYTSYVKDILNVCEQYSLGGCLDDPELDDLKFVVSDVQSEKDRLAMVPVKAVTKLTQLKQQLYVVETKKRQVSPLKLFAAVANSTDFYTFVREKQFYGKKGSAAFQQQYQLITTQLQHEEYDETVLNHLRAAFTLISPFMDSRQNFKGLMCQVNTLDVKNGLKQLETVNTNITLIQLWFSRAEVSYNYR